MPEKRLLLRNLHVPGIAGIETYERTGGYRSLRRAVLELGPDAVLQEVMTSNLRGRGGAGFPTGRKWSFLPKDGRPRYLVCNGDESEPGTCKDQEIIYRLPHLLLEGVLTSAYAIGAEQAFIYLRGEFKEGYRILEQAIAEARAGHFLGDDVLGSGRRLEVSLYLGAGAYICGEETALLESLEGRRGLPRLKPPFPATAGLYGMPTVVNNVETLAAVVPIIEMGGAAYAQLGTEGSAGTKIFSVSGHVRRPGNFEVELGKVTLGELLNDLAGGPPEGRKFKAVIPGGSSVPYLTPDKFDTPLDYESLKAAGTMLGSGGVIVLDDSVSIVDASLRLMEFYRHESCGKCTPCREGTMWLQQALERLHGGEGRRGDLLTIQGLCEHIDGQTFCPLGDAAIAALGSALRIFRDEFDQSIPGGRDRRVEEVAR